MKYQHVRGHQNDYGNNQADKLAVQAANSYIKWMPHDRRKNLVLLICAWPAYEIIVQIIIFSVWFVYPIQSWDSSALDISMDRASCNINTYSMMRLPRASRVSDQIFDSGYNLNSSLTIFLQSIFLQDS